MSRGKNQECACIMCRGRSRIETGSPRISILHTKNLDVEEEGLVVDMAHFDTGAQSVLAYATVNGLLVGWDLRAPRVAWQLKNDPRHGAYI